jgi:ligand-binding SRPBCC domain-containing protein
VGRIVVRTRLDAPAARCFDLARDVGIHCRTSAFTGERVLPPGRTEGLLELGDTIRFEGRHFGVRLQLTAAIVEMDPPRVFVDRATGGGFKWLRHVHEFVEHDSWTEMIDRLDWQASWGLLGTLADRLVVERHMTWYLTTKQQAFKTLAENGDAAR